MTTSEPAKIPLATSPIQRTLRWWPAAFLVVAMVLLRKLPDTMEAPSLPVFMLGLMGPAGLGLLIMLWWLFASRANWKEKLIGFVAVAIIGFAAISLCHFTMQGMSVATIGLIAGCLSMGCLLCMIVGFFLFVHYSKRQKRR